MPATQWTPPQDEVKPAQSSAGGWTPPDDEVKPPVAPAVPQTPKQPQDDKKISPFGEAVSKVATASGLGGLVFGTEGVLSAASQFLGFGGYVAGGAAGLIGESLGMPKGYAADLASRSAENLKFDPVTEEGKKAADTLNYPFKKMGEVSEAAGQKTTDAMIHGYDEQIRHAQQYGAPKWYTGTKSEYVDKLKQDSKKLEDAAPLGGAVVENALGMGLPILGGKGAGMATKGALKALPEAKEKGVGDLPPRPDEKATPEEKQSYLKTIQDTVQKRRDSSRLAETAIRNKETGEVERMGPKHDEARKEETKDTHEQGFVTERGDFLNRKEAYEQAKKNGQLPPDHDFTTLDFPSEGLHSGDLRSVGDKNFHITDEQKVGEPKKEPEPQTRQEHKDAINNLENKFMDHELSGNKVEADKVKGQIDALKKAIPPVEFKDPTKPTWQELQDHLYDAKTVGEALDKIHDSGIGTPQQQILAQALKGLSGVRDAGLEFSQDHFPFKNAIGEDKLARGLYHPDVNVVKMGKDGRVADFLHEAVHAGTYRFLNEGNTFAAQRMQALYSKYKVHDTGQYGFTDVHEFVAEAFTSKNFQNLLSSIKLGDQPARSKLGTLWDEFKDAVKQGLGIPETARSALDEVLNSGASVMEKQEAKHKEESKMFSRGEAANEPKASTGSDDVDKAVDKIDVRTIPNKEAFNEHATDIYETYGEEAALEFLDAYKKDLKDRSIPVPNDNKSLDRAGHTLDGFTTADASESIVGYRDATKEGITTEDREKGFWLRENGGKVGGRLGEILEKIDSEKLALVKKAKGMGLKIGEEFTSGQNRIRLFGTAEKQKRAWKEFFANKTPMGEKVAEQANSAQERKVFGIDGTDRVVELHRVSKDTTMKFKDSAGKERTRESKKGTEVWEWKDGNKELIAHSDNLEAGKTETFKGKDGKDFKLSDGKVSDIEKHSPYRYLHDAEASARLALMGLRKYVREAEYFDNLTKSDWFKEVGHGPDQPLETLPKGWKVPNNIDRIPQLRGWHFDPKTAAIIEDFAKVWDNNSWMKLTNQIVKAIMLNPLPHMMNEFMHLWNARGITGWISPGGLSSLSKTGKQAWNDVANQTQYYRDLMKAGGSILGATPRNNFFEKLQENASKEMFGDKRTSASLGRLATKLGTTAADLYNGLSRKSQQAMWFTRDLMYVQYVREIQDLHTKRTGEQMSLEDATEKAGRHMPTYQMPSEILGSRTIAKVMKNPNLTTFSSYHYGVMNSLINTIKDVDPRLLKTPQGRQQFRDGVDSLLAIGVASAVLYPLADQFAQMIFGDGAEQRRAGPYHVIEGLTDVMKGKKDLTGLLWPVFTFNPMLALMGQLAINKKMFSGKEIYHPDDDLGENIQDAGAFILKQIPQGPPIVSAVQDDGGAGSLIAKQLDIKAQTDQQKTIIDKAKKRQEIAHRSRETARKHGKYHN